MALSEVVREMKALGRKLTPHSFPLASRESEDAVSCLKERKETLDGYEVGLYFNSCQYGEHRLEIVQVFGKYFTFLPLCLVVKVGRAFLGDDNLSLIEVAHSKGPEADDSTRKIYVWTVYYDKEGRNIADPNSEKPRPDSYDGFRFSRVDKDEVKFF